MDKNIEDYTNKYWKEIWDESFEIERKKNDAKGELMKRVISYALACIGLGLLVSFGIFKLQGRETVAGIVFGIFIGDIIAFLGMLLSTRIMASLNERIVVAQRDYKKTQAIKELTPIDGNIQITLPERDVEFFEGSRIPIVIKNKNSNADVKNLYARLELVLRISANQTEKANALLSHHALYQKNLLWNRKPLEDGTINLSADGTEVINLLEVGENFIKFLFQDDESLEILLPANHAYYGCVVILRFYGVINNQPIKNVEKFFTIQGLMLPDNGVSHPESKSKLHITIREEVSL